MKQTLLFPILILCSLSSILCFSQVYKVDEKRIYSWDEFAIPADWEHDNTEQLTFSNGGNKETLLIGFLMPGMEQTYRDNKTYNANNDIILDVGQFWNKVDMQWETISQTVYVYDGSNNLISETDQTYNPISMTYTNSFRELYEYSGTDIIKQTSQTWNYGTDSWDDDEKADITYVSPGNPDIIVYSKWNSGTMMWDAYERDTASYSMGMISEILTEEFTGSWEALDRTTFTYTGSLLTVLLSEVWNGVSWDNEDRELFTYDANDNNTVLIYEEWSFGTMAWVPYFKQEQDFSVAAPLLSTDTFENETFKIFPNPAYDVVNISSSITIEKMELFDILSKQVLTSSNTKQLNIESINTGIYLLKVFADNRTIIKKIVIK